MLDGPDENEDGGGVLSEKSPYEPDEFDPSSLGPDIPEPPKGDGYSDTASLFWQLVIVFNIALLALSIGPMFAYFQGRVQFGLRIFGVGVILFAYGTYRYVKFRRGREAEADDEAGPSVDGEDDEADPSPNEDDDPSGDDAATAEDTDHNG